MFKKLPHNIADADTKIVADHTVHEDLVGNTCLVLLHNAYGLTALLSFEQNGVATEQAQFVHLHLKIQFRPIAKTKQKLPARQTQPNCLPWRTAQQSGDSAYAFASGSQWPARHSSLPFRHEA